VKHERARAAEADGDPGPSAAFLDLTRRSRAALEETLLRGRAPALDELVGWEMRGMNTPPWARALRIRKFVKGFERRPGGEVFGYNRPVRQGRDQAAWQVTGEPFGWYLVGEVDPTARDNAYLHAVLLDYGRGGNKPWSPSRGLRDYVVRVDEPGEELYLGKAYAAVGPARVAVSFFVLERLRRAPAG
jgi:hypothetical protein